jgi:hypothetical protein
VISFEALYHFSCEACGKWWAIAGPIDTVRLDQPWHCPWCADSVVHRLVFEGSTRERNRMAEVIEAFDSLDEGNGPLLEALEWLRAGGNDEEARHRASLLLRWARQSGALA